MAQQVRFDRLGDPHALGMGFDHEPNGLPRNSLPSIAQKKLTASLGLHKMRPARREISLDRAMGLLSHRHDALFGAFAKHANKTLIQINLLQGQVAKLGNPQTTRIKKFKDLLDFQ